MFKKLLLVAPLALVLAACSSSSSDHRITATPPATPPAATPSAPSHAATTPTTSAAPATSTASAATTATSATSLTATSDATATAAPAAPPATQRAPAADGLSAAAAAAMTKAASEFHDNGTWVAGKNYFVIDPPQPKVTETPKIEVVEVFNFGCPACNEAHKIIDKLKASLPSYATMAYLPAGFRPDENWVLYQRTWYAAKALGLAHKSYDAVFDGNWKTGETGSYNIASGHLKAHDQWPDIHTVAKFFASKFGVDPQQFVAVANSFAVNTRIKRADKLVQAYQIHSTPSIVINGRYRFSFNSAGSYDKGIKLADWLVAKEAKRLMAKPAAAN